MEGHHTRVREWIDGGCQGRSVRWPTVRTSKGHFFTQIPQPMHRISEMKASLSVRSTSMQTLPILTTGQPFLHSCAHFFGLHFSWLTMAGFWERKEKGEGGEGEGEDIH